MQKNVFITGSSGLIGTALCGALRNAGANPIPITRDDSAHPAPRTWSLVRERVVIESASPSDAIVHLAGTNIGARRWTPDRKRDIRQSRVLGTGLISRHAAKMTPPPQALICASAVGIYGDRGEEVLTESSTLGEGFLADVGQQWEAAARPAREAGIRTVHLRFGIVLSRDGGALKKMLPTFRLGLGGRVGSGRQYWSWVDLDDVVRAILEVLSNDSFSGVVNVVAPEPVTNREFTRTLAKVLRRPAIFPLPAFAAKIALGEMAEPLLFHGSRVEPAKLLRSGFVFRYPELEGSLRHQIQGDGS